MKLDSSGNLLWAFTQGGENWGDEDYGECVQETRDGDYIACGGFNNYKATLFKVNADGDSLWIRSYGFTDAGFCLEKRTKSEYVLVGDALRASVFSQALYPGISWFLSTDSSGDSLWVQTYGEGVINCIVETSDKGFILTGRKGDDLCLIKTDSLGLLGIAENPIVETDNGWNVANTIGNHIVMSYEDMPQGFHAKVFDVTGRQIDEVHASGSWGTTFWGFEQPAGVYYIKALDNTNHEKSVKVVITD